MEPMREKKPRNVWYLFGSVFGVSALGFYIRSVEPSSWLNISGFFLLFFIALYTLFRYTFNNVRHALLGSVGLTGILLLRALGLRELYYAVLFLITFLVVDHYVNTSRRI